MKKLITMLSIPLLALAGHATAGDDQVIADVYGQKVTAADVAVPEKMMAESRKTLSAEEFAALEQDNQRQMLAYGIMEEARKRFLAEMKLTPTDQEIDAYIEAQNRMMAAGAAKQAHEREQLEQKLSQPDLAPDQREMIEKDIAAMDELAQMFERPAAGDASDEDKAAERSVATMMVANWNFNQGLYQKYGGRVIFQQAGMEPIDGHKAFLEALKASGEYSIIDPAYQDVFKESDEYLNKKFDLVDKAEADEYFASPWWLKAAKPAE